MNIDCNGYACELASVDSYGFTGGPCGGGLGLGFYAQSGVSAPRMSEATAYQMKSQAIDEMEYAVTETKDWTVGAFVDVMYNDPNRFDWENIILDTFAGAIIAGTANVGKVAILGLVAAPVALPAYGVAFIGGGIKGGVAGFLKGLFNEVKEEILRRQE